VNIDKLATGIRESGIAGHTETYRLTILVPFGTEKVPKSACGFDIFFAAVGGITFAAFDYSTSLYNSIREFENIYAEGIL